MKEIGLYAVFANFISTTLLTVTFFYLYKYGKEKFMQLWTFAWAIYALRFVFEFLFHIYKLPILSLGMLTASLISALLLLSGARQMVHKKVEFHWYLLTILTLLFLIIVSCFNYPTHIAATPIMLFSGLIHIYTGIIFYNEKEREFSLAYITVAVVFILWGVHKFDYPFAHYFNLFVVEGYWLASFLSQCCAILMIIIYFEKNKIARIKSEERYKSYVSNSPNAIFITDVYGNILEVNKKAVDMTEYTESELLKMNVVALHPQLEREEVLPGMFKEINNTKSVKREIPILKKNGVLIEALVHSIFIDDEFFIGFVSDISDLKEKERENKRMHEKMLLNSKLTSIGELTAGIGHEINNPLTVLEMNFERLKAKFIQSDSETSSMIQKIDHALTRISSVVTGLRTFARFEENNIEQVPVNQVIKNTLSLVQIIYEKDGVELVYKDLQDELFFFGNKNSFQQVIINLLTNAKDASEGLKERKVELNVTSESGKIFIRVLDNGIGIEPQNLSKIFDSFFTTKPTGKGTGLGLPIVKNIIDGFQGVISVEKTSSKGTIFLIELPLSYGEIKKTSTFARIATSSIKKMRGKVLVVDDEPDIRELIIHALTKIGLTVEESPDGEDAFEKITKTPDYDYLVTDLRMPGISGLDLIEKVRNSTNFKGKILIVTGEITPLDREHVDGVINKPFNSKKIQEIFLKFVP